MMFGDFGASVSASALPAGELHAAGRGAPRSRAVSSTPPGGEVYVPHPHGGTVGVRLQAGAEPEAGGLS
jgi:hypothetical protein